MSSSNQYSRATYRIRLTHRTYRTLSRGASYPSRSRNRRVVGVRFRLSDEARCAAASWRRATESTPRDAHERLISTPSHCPIRRRGLERRDSAAADAWDLRRLGGRRASHGSARLARRARARRPVRRRWPRADGEGADRVPRDRHVLAVRPRRDPRRPRAGDAPLVDGPRGTLAPLSAEPAQRPGRRSCGWS